MSDIRTRKVTRAQIAESIGNNPRLIKLIEALTSDVGDTLPAEVQSALMVAVQSYLSPSVRPQPPSVDWQALAIGQALTACQKVQPGVDWQTALAAGLLRREQIQQAQQALSLTQQFVAVSADTSIPNARVLTAGSNVTLDTSTPGQIIVSAGGGGGSGAGNITPDTHPASPSAWDDEFEYGTSLDTTGARFSGANPWSWQYPVGSFTSNVDRGYISLHAPSVGGSINLNMAVQPLSTTPFKIRAKQFDNWGDTIYGGGICVIGASGRWYTFGKIFNVAVRLRVEHGNSATAVSGVDYTADIFSASNNARSWVHGMVLEIEYDGTLIYFRHSDTGKDGTFKTVFSTLLSTWLIDVASIGIFYKNNGTGTGPSGWTVLDWFRRIS